MRRRYYKYPKWAVLSCKIGTVLFTSLLFWVSFYAYINFDRITSFVTQHINENKHFTNNTKGPYSDALSSNFKVSKK